ncbi:hypothetical protein [Legionella sp. W10-070]|nr:hypothetical protein [Legionella sp. W10-070]
MDTVHKARQVGKMKQFYVQRVDAFTLGQEHQSLVLIPPIG